MRFNSIYKVFILQLGIVVLSTIISWVIYGLQSALSLVLGGIIVILPTLLFAFLFFHKKQRKPERILNSFYFGELIKIFLTIGLFIIILQWKALHPLAMFMGFIIAQITYWIGCIYTQ